MSIFLHLLVLLCFKQVCQQDQTEDAVDSSIRLHFPAIETSLGAFRPSSNSKLVMRKTTISFDPVTEWSCPLDPYQMNEGPLLLWPLGNSANEEYSVQVRLACSARKIQCLLKTLFTNHRITDVKSILGLQLYFCISYLTFFRLHFTLFVTRES